MRLWLISQDKNTGYDTFDSAVVAAYSEDDARKIHPGGYAYQHDRWTDTWAEPEDVTVKPIGEALPDVEAGVVLASFNAG